MKKLFFYALSCLAFTGFLISCAVLPPVVEDIPPVDIEAVPPVIPELPLRPIMPPVPEFIMGRGIVPAEDMAAFLLGANTGIDEDFVEELAVIYVEEAALEGINHDVAFAQMCLETGFLRFGNLVTPEMYNFAGLGATGLPGPDGLPVRGLYFPSPRIGVRAQIQHLKAYASETPLNQELVNPRYHLIRLGRSPAISGLAGTWAADPHYAEKINNILEQLYSFSFGTLAALPSP